MARLVLINGAPGVGKSTLAMRYGDAHPGTLVLEIDTMRTMVAGWQRDVVGVGERIRSTALAAATAYLREGGDVLVPQLLGSAGQVARFEQAALDGDAGFVHVLLTATDEEVVRRFRGRGDDHPWSAHVRAIVDEAGGDEALREWGRRLALLEGTRLPGADRDGTYRALLVALGEEV